MAEAIHTPSPTRLSAYAPGVVRAATRRAQTARQVPAMAVRYLYSVPSVMQSGSLSAGLVCTDGGITSGVVLSEYGYADFGANYGGERTSVKLLSQRYIGVLLLIVCV